VKPDNPRILATVYACPRRACSHFTRRAQNLVFTFRNTQSYTGQTDVAVALRIPGPDPRSLGDEWGNLPVNLATWK
jgi:hypothetical protein